MFEQVPEHFTCYFIISQHTVVKSISQTYCILYKLSCFCMQHCMCPCVMDTGYLKVAHTHGVPYLSPTQQLMELALTLIKVNMHLLDQSPHQWQHWMRLEGRYSPDFSCLGHPCQSCLGPCKGLLVYPAYALLPTRYAICS